MPPRTASLTLRRPPSHWAVPLLLAGTIWIPYAALVGLPRILHQGPASTYVLTGTNYVLRYVTLREIASVSGLVTGLCFLFFLFGLTRIRLSEAGVQWEVLPWIWRRWRWTSLREIRVQESGRYFEDDELSKRTIVITGPGPLGIGLDCLRLTNRVWDRYDEAESAVVAVGVPSIAARLTRRLQKSSRPEHFPLTGSIGLGTALIYLGLTLLSLVIAFRDDLWIGPLAVWGPGSGSMASAVLDGLWTGTLEAWRPLFMAFAVVFFLLSLRGLLAQSVAVDLRYFYVLRRGWVQKRIPLDSIADIDTRDNSTRLRVWKDKAGTKTREVWRTDTYIRNRGVLLHLVRELVQGRIQVTNSEQEDPVTPTGGIAAGPRRVLTAASPKAIPPMESEESPARSPSLDPQSADLRP